LLPPKALDAESELVVQEALDNIVAHKNITTVIVAHRLSTIRHADKINVIVGGRLVESGTHNELMETASYYRKMVDKQEGLEDDELNSSSRSSSRAPSRQSSAFDMSKLEEQDAPEADNGVAHVEFKNVSFAYPTRPQKTILSQFNLKVQQGQTVAIVGESGSGKSTTTGLLERFYDPLEGSVEYFGEDIKTLNVSWYRDQLGYVGQEPTLFDDTIARNVAYGAPGASQAEIELACRQANAHDYIVQFPEAYDTPVGQHGTQLSGGQKQRVAIGEFVKATANNEDGCPCFLL
jgi:ABC-type multidrug transport system fused ATPase/permease subunit